MRGSAALLLTVGLALAPTGPVGAQSVPGGEVDDGVVRVEALRIGGAEAPRVDGTLSEEVWSRAPVIGELRQMEPFEGRPSSESVEVRILYTEAALYVGARLHDRGEVSARMGRRDMDLEDADWFGIALDSQHDRRNAYLFQVSPAGVQRDAILSDGSGSNAFSQSEDTTWDAVWESATRIDADGWTVEMRIPLSQLPIPERAVHTWGLQVERIIGREQERSVLAFVPRDERGGISRYAHLEGIRNISPGQPLELRPYVVMQGESVDRGANPFRDTREGSVSGGLDLRYRLSGDLLLTATLNPDFGQVEVDPAVVNLGVYETFFQERRPFFLEGTDVFDFGGGSNAGGRLFYTRRMGRSPQLPAPTPRSDTPRQANILGAAKLTGRTDGGWRFGVMEAVTARSETRFMDEAGESGRVVAEPLTNYAAVRVRRDLRQGASYVGGMLTSVLRESDPARADLFLPSSAWAGGVDFRHEWDQRRWLVQGSVVGTRVAGSPESLTRIQRAGHHFFQRPDAPHLGVDSTATALTGMAASATLARRVGRNWQAQFGGAVTTPAFEVNDMGFGTRTDRRDVSTQVSYTETTAGQRLRSWNASGRVRYEFNFNGEMIANWHTLRGSATTLDFLEFSGSLTHRTRANDDRRTRGGPLTHRPAHTSFSGSVATDRRRAVGFRVDAGVARDEAGGLEDQLQTRIVIRPSSRWELQLAPEVIRFKEAAQYVATLPDPDRAATFGRGYIFASLDQTTVSLETRLNVALSPTLSIQAYAQPFLSAGDYGDPTVLERPSSFAFAPWTGTGEVPDRDFNLRSLRGNAVLRWEWNPGSVLYVAWQQNRRDMVRGLGDFDFSRDRSALFRAPADNILIVKANLWVTP